MVKEWKTPLLCLVEAGVKRFVMHMDSFSPVDTIDLLSIAHDRGLEIGIAVSNTKDVHFHKHVIQTIQEKWRRVFIQVMGIETIGIQGQPLDHTAPERVATLKGIFATIPIQVDGAMNAITVPLMNMKGADGVVVGSYLFSDGKPKETLEALQLSLQR
jgi:pentose-5-phosphate-3-epimerase